MYAAEYASGSFNESFAPASSLRYLDSDIPMRLAASATLMLFARIRNCFSCLPKRTFEMYGE